MTTTELPIDLTNERVITLAEAARLIPGYRSGTRCHPSRMHRARLHGVITPDGRRCRLAAIRIGSGWVTSVEAVERWIAEQQPQPAETPAADAVRSPAERRRASEEAAKMLEQLGC